jgi:hypothetical protein
VRTPSGTTRTITCEPCARSGQDHAGDDHPLWLLHRWWAVTAHVSRCCAALCCLSARRRSPVAVSPGSSCRVAGLERTHTAIGWILPGRCWCSSTGAGSIAEQTEPNRCRRALYRNPPCCSHALVSFDRFSRIVSVASFSRKGHTLGRRTEPTAASTPSFTAKTVGYLGP